MRILYILSIILLAIGFFAHKKSDQKLNSIKWATIFIISLMGLNITLSMVLGLLKIKSYLWLLSLIYTGIGIALGYKVFKNKEFQKYTASKQDILGLVAIFLIFSVLVVKEIRPQDGGLKYAAVDSAIHYRAAKHFADNLIIFVNCEDKTIFNFNVMQTGAYINDGILMNVANGLFGIQEYYIYEFFEISMILLTCLAFYSLIMDKIKGKLGFVLTMILMWLYMFAYPYNSYMYGFSYLSVGIMFTTMLISVVQMLFSEEKISKWLVIALISLISMGVIFSYSLFVPGVFAAVCIYIFIKEFKQDDKKYLKFFGKNTLIVTGILLLITALGIGYLFIPTFFIANQSNLVEALKNPGGMYSELYKNFVFYAIFGVLYVVDIVMEIKKKEFKPEFLDVFSWVFGAYFAVVWLGMRMGFVSDYYFFKMYYVLWGCILAVTIKLVNKYITQKYFKIAIPVYEFAWVLLVIGTVLVKSTTLFPECRNKLPNYVGVYFDQNCDYRGLIQAYNHLAKDQIELLEFVKTLDDVKPENMLLISGSNYERAWTLAIADLRSDTVRYNKVIEDAARHTIQEGLSNPNVKYIIKIGQTDDILELEAYSNIENKPFEVLHSGYRTFVLRKL